MSRIFIRNIPPKIKENDLEMIFSKCGPVEELILKNNFAFIQYPSVKSSEEAIKKFHNSTLSGNQIVVEFAKTRSEKLEERQNEKCFKCGHYGHWAKDCTESSKNLTSIHHNKENNKILFDNRNSTNRKKKFKNLRKSPKRSFCESNSSRSRSRSSSNSK